MKATIVLTSVLLLISSEAGAQSAVYDANSAMLTIPAVSVGSTIYGNVSLRNIGNYTFTLQMAIEQPALATAEGVWRGTGGGSLFTGVVLDNGVYYFFYSPPGSPNAIGGLLYGSSSSAGGVFSSGDTKDFNFEELRITSLGPLSGSYQPRQWFFGTKKDSSGETSIFGAIFDPFYDVAPSLAAIAGTYSGQARFAPPFGVENLSVTVGASGTMGGTLDNCSFVGALTPRSRGNLYNMSVTLGSGCQFPGQTFSGIAYIDAWTHRLWVGAVNAPGTAAGVFAASK